MGCLTSSFSFFFFNDTATTEIYTLSLHDALPISRMLIAYLAYTGPMVRTMTRYKTRAKALTGLAGNDGVRQRPTINWLRRTVRLDYWNNESIPRHRLMDKIRTFLPPTCHAPLIEPP